MIGLFLGGGGAKGVWQYEQLEKLFASGYCPDMIFGTSVGALHAALIGTGQFTEGKSIWNTISDRKIFRFSLKNILFTDGYYSYKPLEKLVKEYLIGKTVQVPFAVTVVERSTKEIAYKFFKHGEVITDHTYKWILASAAMPVIWPSVEIDGKYYVDGGIRDNVPLGTMIDSGITDITAITTENPFIFRNIGKVRKGISGKIHNLSDTLDTYANELLRNDLATIKMYNTCPKPHHVLVQVKILVPETPLPFGPLGFDEASKGTTIPAILLNLSDPRL